MFINGNLSLLTLSLVGAACVEAQPPKRAAFTPVIKGSPEVIGLVADPTLNRDSCGSVRFQNQDFWTCRDTQVNDAQGRPGGATISSTAGWTTFNFDGTPFFEAGSNGRQILQMRGNNRQQPYFPLQQKQCQECNQCDGNPAGACSDGTRYAIWPDSPPMVTSGQLFGSVTAYTWIKNSKIRGLTLVENNPSVTLHKITYNPGTSDRNALPATSVVDGSFWPAGSFAYGAYGNVNHNGWAYLYAQADDNNRPVALARVPAGSVEDKSKYQYWVGGSWTTTRPSISDARAHLTNAGAGGQGTFYWYEQWQRYVWIGQPALSISAYFMITTAPEPQGPWDQPVFLYQGQDGNATLPAYSLQAHPDLTSPQRNEVYLTYTKVDRWNGVAYDVYSTPMIRIRWQ